MALKLAPTIRVNCVIPGSIWTEETEQRFHSTDPARRQEKERQIPLGRIGTPGEIADVVAFLLSAAARYINGQPIIIDGGQSLL